MEANTIFDFFYIIVTTYILPETTNYPDWENILIILCAVLAVATMWAFLIRPFWWLLKYGLFGGSKKQKRLNNWNND